MGFQHMTKERLAEVSALGSRGLIKSRRAREMSEIERAWIGAFLEADGHCGVYNRRGGSGTSRHLHLAITQSIKNPEPISAALRLTQVGSVSVSNGQMHWQVSALNDVLAIAEQIEPYSEKAQRTLQEWKSAFL